MDGSNTSKSGVVPLWAYKDILGQLQEGVIVVSAKGPYRHMNKTAAQLYGFETPEEFMEQLPRLGELFELRTYPDRQLLTPSAWPIEQLRGGVGHVHAELYVRRLDTNTEVIIEYVGKVIRGSRKEAPFIVLTLRDITEQKVTSLANARQAAFFQTALDAIVTIDHAGTITEFNPAAEQIFGYSRAEALGCEMATLIIPEEFRTAHREGMAHYLKVDSGPLIGKHIEVTATRRDGNIFPVELFIARIGTSNPPTFMGTLRDITSRKRNEEKLIESEAQIRTMTEINRAKDEFIALASHQLRTPATGVKQYVGMLLQGYGGTLDAQQMELLQTAYESNERQLDVINSLLNVAQIDAGKVSLMRSPSRIDHMLHDIVREQAETFQARKQTLTLDAPPKPVTGNVDYRLIRMVIENIIDNAGKYSPQDKTISVRLTNTGRAVTITVTDQGVGISKHDQTKLFQKFTRIDNNLSTLVNGSGLGLYWAKKILDLHDATIGVTSKPQHGSTFTITIPKRDVVT